MYETRGVGRAPEGVAIFLYIHGYWALMIIALHKAFWLGSSPAFLHLTKMCSLSWQQIALGPDALRLMWVLCECRSQGLLRWKQRSPGLSDNIAIRARLKPPSGFRKCSKRTCSGWDWDSQTLYIKVNCHSYPAQMCEAIQHMKSHSSSKQVVIIEGKHKKEQKKELTQSVKVNLESCFRLSFINMFQGHSITEKIKILYSDFLTSLCVIFCSSLSDKVKTDNLSQLENSTTMTHSSVIHYSECI